MGKSLWAASRGYLHCHELNELTFDLSARAFFQLNPQQTSILYQEGLKALDLSKNETVVDAYCGVGTIGLSVAPYAKEVRGMDIIPQAFDSFGLTVVTQLKLCFVAVMPRNIHA